MADARDDDPRYYPLELAATLFGEDPDVLRLLADLGPLPLPMVVRGKVRGDGLELVSLADLSRLHATAGGIPR